LVQRTNSILIDSSDESADDQYYTCAIKQYTTVRICIHYGIIYYKIINRGKETSFEASSEESCDKYQSYWVEKIFSGFLVC
jgi:hypothetical protein